MPIDCFWGLFSYNIAIVLLSLITFKPCCNFADKGSRRVRKCGSIWMGLFLIAAVIFIYLRFGYGNIFLGSWIIELGEVGIVLFLPICGMFSELIKKQRKSLAYKNEYDKSFYYSTLIVEDFACAFILIVVVYITTVQHAT